MNSIIIDAPMSDEKKRELLYRGQLLVYSPTPSSLALVDFAREMVEEAFHPLDPETAQFHLPVEKYAAILSELKPKFIHAQESKKCIQGILSDVGFSLEKTYFDVPRMRSSTSDDFLTSGIAYAFHPHRDTWYSAPMCQINWWFPIFDIASDNCLALYPEYFGESVENNSDIYNYQLWNRTNRVDAAKHVRSDSRQQPKPARKLDLRGVRLICPPEGMILF